MINGNNDLINYKGNLIDRIGNSISVTNKLLALSEPKLIPYRKGFKWGFCTPEKKLVANCEYDEVRPFCEGMALVSLKYETSYYSIFSYLSGFINHLGNLTIPIKYQYGVRNFSEGLAAIEVDGKYGFIDKKGEIAIPCIYSYAGDFFEGLASVMMNDHQGFINKSGKVVIDFKYGNIDRSEGWILSGKDVFQFKKGVAKVKVDNKYGFIDKNDNIIVEFIYDDVENFSEGLAVISKVEITDLKNESGEIIFEDAEMVYYGFIDESGNVVIPTIYEWASDFTHGLACVEINGTYGYIDKNGKTIIPFIYDNAREFAEDLACVKIPTVPISISYGFINLLGEPVIPFIYSDANSFSDGLAAVKKNGKYGFIDKTGTIIIPFEYGEVESFKNGLARVKVEKYDNAWDGYINKENIRFWED